MNVESNFFLFHSGNRIKSASINFTDSKYKIHNNDRDYYMLVESISQCKDIESFYYSNDYLYVSIVNENSERFILIFSIVYNQYSTFGLSFELVKIFIINENLHKDINFPIIYFEDDEDYMYIIDSKHRLYECDWDMYYDNDTMNAKIHPNDDNIIKTIDSKITSCRLISKSVKCFRLLFDGGMYILFQNGDLKFYCMNDKYGIDNSPDSIIEIVKNIKLITYYPFLILNERDELYKLEYDNENGIFEKHHIPTISEIKNIVKTIKDCYDVLYYDGTLARYYHIRDVFRPITFNHGKIVEIDQMYVYTEYGKIFTITLDLPIILLDPVYNRNKNYQSVKSARNKK